MIVEGCYNFKIIHQIKTKKPAGWLKGENTLFLKCCLQYRTVVVEQSRALILERSSHAQVEGSNPANSRSFLNEKLSSKNESMQLKLRLHRIMQPWLLEFDRSKHPMQLMRACRG